MRVLGAIETAGGDTIIARIKNVSQTDFTDEEDRNSVRFLPPNENSDELFFAKTQRHVRADNTFYLRRARYEAPRHLPNRTIQTHRNTLR